MKINKYYRDTFYPNKGIHWRGDIWDSFTWHMLSHSWKPPTYEIEVPFTFVESRIINPKMIEENFLSPWLVCQRLDIHQPGIKDKKCMPKTHHPYFAMQEIKAFPQYDKREGKTKRGSNELKAPIR